MEPKNSEILHVSTEPLTSKFQRLEGERLILEPLSESHTEQFYALIDPEIWKWYTVQIKNEDDMKGYIQKHLEDCQSGRTQAFAIKLKENHELIGSSSYINIDKFNRRVEIGSTWYAPKWQRTFVNTECKLLLLDYAFETLGCICVQFHTDNLNERSREAIQRLGAKLDGVLRHHRICQDGRVRHSAVYSITEAEWPPVKEHIQGLLDRGESPEEV